MAVKASYDEKRKTLAKLFHSSDLYKGLQYYPGYLGQLHKRGRKDDKIVYFDSSIESERTTKIYNIEFTFDQEEQKVIEYHCSCPQFAATNSCKHLVAVMYYFYDNIFVPMIDDKYKEKQTLKLIEMFNSKETQREIKEEVKLEIELTGENLNVYHPSLNVTLKIGTSKLYQCKDTKLRNFLEAYEKKEEFYFGKTFTYNPNNTYFNKENTEILDFLVLLNNNRQSSYYYASSGYLNGNYNIKKFLLLTQNKKITINNYIREDIKKEFPFQTNLDLKNDKYHLNINIDTKNLYFLTSDLEYLQIKNTIYILNNQNKDLLKEILNNEISELIFDKNNKESFKNSILPIVKDNITIDEKITDIKLTHNITPKIYFDLYKDTIICNLKFLYDDVEIDYFDKDTTVIRDNNKEMMVINYLKEYNFQTSDNTIYLSDIDLIGTFIEDDLKEISEKYDVYTSENLKKVKIIKKTNVSSTFKIGQDNILSYSFDLGDIKENEIVNILEQIKNKKKYYRLKSGDLVDLEDKNLLELESLTNDLNISKTDLKKGNGVIPKYRAIYLDSLKNDKYHIIKTDNMFDNLISKFNAYKDCDIHLSKKDKELLRGYQVEGVKWLYNVDASGFGGILADEMGLGKSIQTIYYIKELLKENKDYKFLIVAPTSLAYNWEAEFLKFGKELKYKVFVGLKKERLKLFDELDKYNIIITTYGLLREDYDNYKEMKFKTLIIDEAQTIKNVHAGISKTVKSINADTKFALTGTPIENSLLELWSIFDFIMPGFLANLEVFDKKYKIKEIDDDANQKLSSLNKLVSPFIMRRRKKDVMKDLPEKIENNIYIDLDTEQKKLYLAELEKVKEAIDKAMLDGGMSKVRFMMLSLLTKLRQLCIDPKIIYPDYKGKSGKLEEFVKVVQESILNGHKILIFTSFKSALEIARDLLKKEGITSFTIDGSVTSKKRMEMVDKFNNDNTNVFFIMLKAGGTGLNLTGADVVMHLDLWWNPQVENQATDRAHRIGQENTVQVIRFISKGTIEEKILALQSKKKLLSDKILDSNNNQNIFSKLTEKDIKELLSYDNKEE